MPRRACAAPAPGLERAQHHNGFPGLSECSRSRLSSDWNAGPDPGLRGRRARPAGASIRSRRKMRETAILKLVGALADAVAVEWTEAAAPLDSAAGWQACTALGDGRWRLAGCGAATAHGLASGDRLAIGLRCRLVADGPWSPVPLDRDSLERPGGVPVPPLLLLPPLLAGTGKIGSEVVVAPGLWGGFPAPDLALQWCRDGAAIPGATGSGYVPGRADDRTRLTCCVRAASLAGTATAETAALAITHVAPRGGGDDFRGDLRPGLGRADRRGEALLPGRGAPLHGDGCGSFRRCPERQDQHPDRCGALRHGHRGGDKLRRQRRAVLPGHGRGGHRDPSTAAAAGGGPAGAALEDRHPAHAARLPERGRCRGLRPRRRHAAVARARLVPRQSGRHLRHAGHRRPLAVARPWPQLVPAEPLRAEQLPGPRRGGRSRRSAARPLQHGRQLQLQPALPGPLRQHRRRHELRAAHHRRA